MTLVKSAPGKLSVETKDIGMSKEEIEVLRWHGAKATLSSVMQHLNLPKRAVRWQGNWKSQAETMPDTYLRESQVLILSSQEKCLEYLRQGGDLVRLVGEPVGLDKSQEDREKDADRRAGSMATIFGAGADPAKVTKDFLDDCFKDGKIPREAIEKEAMNTVATKDLEQYLETEEQDSPGYDPTSTASEGEVAKAKKEQGTDTLADPQEAR